MCCIFQAGGQAAVPHHVHQKLVLEGYEVELLVQLPFRTGLLRPSRQQLLDFAVLRMPVSCSSGGCCAGHGTLADAT